MRARPVDASADLPYVVLHAPGVLVFADDPRHREVLGEAIVGAGGRLVASGSLADVAERLDRRAAHVVVDIDSDGGAALDGILDRLNGRGAAGGRSSVLVLTTLDMLDLVVARIDDPGVAILVDPDSAERDAALAELVAAPFVGRVTEDGEAEKRRRLAQLGEEVGRIARALAALSGDRTSRPAHAVATTRVHDAPLVRSILRLRRLRGLHFEPALFADPAWDILLDLAAARIEGRTVAVSSLCIAAAVPATTALRWIAQMTEQALLVRQPDANDRRRMFIGLSDAAATAMGAYIEAASRIVAPVG